MVSLQIGLERRSFPEANCFLRVTRRIAPFFEVRITSLALTMEIILFLEAKHLNVLTSPALLGWNWQRCSQAMSPINRTLIVLLRETYFSLFGKFVYDISLLPKQGD